jgi:hypothetical protein
MFQCEDPLTLKALEGMIKIVVKFKKQIRGVCHHHHYSFIHNTSLTKYETKLTNSLLAVLTKLRVAQLVKKFPAFHGTQRPITAFTRARH